MKILITLLLIHFSITTFSQNHGYLMVLSLADSMNTLEHPEDLNSIHDKRFYLSNFDSQGFGHFGDPAFYPEPISITYTELLTWAEINVETIELVENTSPIWKFLIWGKHKETGKPRMIGISASGKIIGVNYFSPTNQMCWLIQYSSEIRCQYAEYMHYEKMFYTENF